ncbi:MAG: hypothetical protein ACRD2L_03530 [Terriglobia bacterium]
MRFLRAVALAVVITPTAFLPVCLAETKVIAAEATYTMGDGESPSFAEAQVLRKAKRAALEQAGTYVEAYTKSHNYDLTTEEIQTLAGGVMKVEVLKKTRTLVGEGLRFYTKIKATVTTDKMEELARRIRGKNVAEEYKKLKAEYARLTRELETWKQVAAGAATGAERQTALDRIKESEKAFARVQENEATLFRRLLSGQALISQAQDTKVAIGRLVDDIIAVGHEIVVGTVSVHLPKDVKRAAKYDEWDDVTVTVPVTVKASPSLARILADSARSFGGNGILPDRASLHLRYGGQVTDELVLNRLAMAQAQQTFALDGFPGRYGYYDTYVKGAEFVLSGNRRTSRDFQEELADLVLLVRLSLEDGKQYSCAASSIVNRLILGRAAVGAFSFFFIELGNTQDSDAVVLLKTVVSFEVEFTLPQKAVTHLKGAEAKYGKSQKAPKERCRLILPGR